MKPGLQASLTVVPSFSPPARTAVLLTGWRLSRGIGGSSDGKTNMKPGLQASLVLISSFSPPARTACPLDWLAPVKRHRRFLRWENKHETRLTSELDAWSPVCFPAVLNSYRELYSLFTFLATPYLKVGTGVPWRFGLLGRCWFGRLLL